MGSNVSGYGFRPWAAPLFGVRGGSQARKRPAQGALPPVFGSCGAWHARGWGLGPQSSSQYFAAL